MADRRVQVSAAAVAGLLLLGLLVDGIRVASNQEDRIAWDARDPASGEGEPSRAEMLRPGVLGAAGGPIETKDTAPESSHRRPTIEPFKGGLQDSAGGGATGEGRASRRGSLTPVKDPLGKNKSFHAAGGTAASAPVQRAVRAAAGGPAERNVAAGTRSASLRREMFASRGRGRGLSARGDGLSRQSGFHSGGAGAAAVPAGRAVSNAGFSLADERRVTAGGMDSPGGGNNAGLGGGGGVIVGGADGGVIGEDGGAGGGGEGGGEGGGGGAAGGEETGPAISGCGVQEDGSRATRCALLNCGRGVWRGMLSPTADGLSAAAKSGAAALLGEVVKDLEAVIKNLNTMAASAPSSVNCDGCAGVNQCLTSAKSQIAVAVAALEAVLAQVQGAIGCIGDARASGCGALASAAMGKERDAVAGPLGDLMALSSGMSSCAASVPVTRRVRNQDGGWSDVGYPAGVAARSRFEQYAGYLQAAMGPVHATVKDPWCTRHGPLCANSEIAGKARELLGERSDLLGVIQEFSDSAPPDIAAIASSARSQLQSGAAAAGGGTAEGLFSGLDQIASAAQSIQRGLSLWDPHVAAACGQ